MSDNRTSLLVELCQIMRDYGLDVDNAWTDRGTVAQPGKFEGEPIETLYFFNHMLNGSGENIAEWDVFAVDPTDRQIFGFEAETTHYGVRTSGQGFVYGAQLTAAEYQELCDAADKAGDEFAEENATD